VPSIVATVLKLPLAWSLTIVLTSCQRYAATRTVALRTLSERQGSSITR
jgi:hypothetical protein